MDSHPLQDHVLTPEQQQRLRLSHVVSPQSRSSGTPTNIANGNGRTTPISHPVHPELRLPTPRESSRAPQSILSPGPKSPTNEPLSYLEAMLLMTRGEEFVKFACSSSVFRRTSKEKRVVFYDKDASSPMGELYWCKPGMRVKDPTRCIPLSQVTGLYEQAETSAFGTNLSPAERARCFSIVCGPSTNSQGEATRGRTLDLQASTVAVRDTWMHCIHQILINSGYDVHERDADGRLIDTAQTRHSVEQTRSVSSSSRKSSKTSSSLKEASDAPLPMEYFGYMQSPTQVYLHPSPSPSEHRDSLTSPLRSQSRSSVAASPPAAARFDSIPEKEVDAPFDDATKTDETVLTVNGASPLASEKLIASMSPASADKLSLSHDEREIPATLTVPTAALANNHQHALSPSEHPTLTPMCSPTVA